MDKNRLMSEIKGLRVSPHLDVDIKKLVVEIRDSLDSKEMLVTDMAPIFLGDNSEIIDRLASAVEMIITESDLDPNTVDLNSSVNFDLFSTLLIRREASAVPSDVAICDCLRDILPMSEKVKLFRDDLSRQLDESGIESGPLPKGVVSTKLETGHIIHAVDAVVTDGSGVILITRKEHGGQNKLALPGGFLDHGEFPKNAAFRELAEETNFTPEIDESVPIANRNYNRPQDVRYCTSSGLESGYGVKKDDVFTVSTQGFAIEVPDLGSVSLKAGDDAKAGSAHAYKLASLSREDFGFPDHYDLLVAGMYRTFPNETLAIVGKEIVSRSLLFLGDTVGSVSVIWGKICSKESPEEPLPGL